ncbi:hypothetical protein L9W73_16925, partial [Vibrio aestuarianus]|nr:hypothetical protein [Vibrio aestuarianus]
MYFIDQLFMQQDYPDGGLPFVGTHVIERIDMETGEKLPPNVNQKILEARFQIISATFMDRCRRGSQLLKVVR